MASLIQVPDRILHISAQVFMEMTGAPAVPAVLDQVETGRFFVGDV